MSSRRIFQTRTVYTDFSLYRTILLDLQANLHGENIVITPVLKALQWLLIRQHSCHKVMTLSFLKKPISRTQHRHGIAPAYLSDLYLLSIKVHRGPQTGQWYDGFEGAHTKTTMQNWFEAFGNIGPRAWNTIPTGIRNSKTLDCLKRKKKPLTH